MLAVCLALIDDESDKKGFEQLVHKYENRLYTVAYGILKSHSLAEDAVWNTFFNVANNYKKICDLPVHKMEAYLIVTIRNASYRIYNSEKKHINDISIENSEINIPVADFNKFDTDLLSQAISELDEKYRYVIAYRYFYGLNADEIAKLMGIARRTVYKYCNHALEVLAQKLGSDFYE